MYQIKLGLIIKIIKKIQNYKKKVYLYIYIYIYIYCWGKNWTKLSHINQSLSLGSSIKSNNDLACNWKLFGREIE
jgi:hypothetical protein